MAEAFRRHPIETIPEILVAPDLGDPGIPKEIQITASPALKPPYNFRPVKATGLKLGQLFRIKVTYDKPPQRTQIVTLNRPDGPAGSIILILSRDLNPYLSPLDRLTKE